MSDYVKAKVIRLPFPESLMKKLNVDSIWECEDYLDEKQRFEIGCTDKAYYIDYIVEYQCGCCDGEYGYAFYLDEKDKEKYCPLFDKLDIEYNPDDLRKVVYCYYNSCECPDYYDPEEITFENL